MLTLIVYEIVSVLTLIVYEIVSVFNIYSLQDVCVEIDSVVELISSYAS